MTQILHYLQSGLGLFDIGVLQFIREQLNATGGGHAGLPPFSLASLAAQGI